MDIKDFRSLIDTMVKSVPERETAEQEYHALEQNSIFQVICLHLSNISARPPHSTFSISLIMLSRTIKSIGEEFLAIGDASFHNSFRACLLSAFSSSDLSTYDGIQLANLVSTSASSYAAQNQWPELFQSLLSLASQFSEGFCPSAVNCISQCVNNRSISIESAGHSILNLLCSIFESTSKPQTIIPPSLLLLFSVLSTPPAIAEFMPLAPMLPSALLAARQSDLPTILSNLTFAITKATSAFFEPISDEIANLLIQFASNKDLPISSRTIALSTFTTMLTVEPTHFFAQSENLITFLVECLQEVESPDAAMEDPSLSSSLSAAAESAIYDVAEIFCQDLDFSGFLLDVFDALFANTTQRRSAWVLLRATAEFNPQILTYQTDEYFEKFLVSMSDGDPSVRQACYTALSAICRFYPRIDSSDEDSCIDSQSAWLKMLEVMKLEQNPVVMKAALDASLEFVDFFRGTVVQTSSFTTAFLWSAFSCVESEEKVKILEIFGILCSFKEFAEFVPPLLELILNVFSDLCQQIPRIIFFECIDLFPTVGELLSEPQLKSCSEKCLEVIQNVPMDDLTDSEKLRMIRMMRFLSQKFIELRQCFYEKMLSVIFAHLSCDLTYDEKPLAEYVQSEESGGSAVFMNSTSSVRIYSNSQIDDITESLSTLRSLLIEAVDLVSPQLSTVLKIVMKWLKHQFLQGIVAQSIFLASTIIPLFDYSSGTEQFQELFLGVISAWMSINDTDFLTDLVPYIGNFIQAFCAHIPFAQDHILGISGCICQQLSNCQKRAEEKKEKANTIKDVDDTWRNDEALEESMIWLALPFYVSYQQQFEPIFMSTFALLYPIGTQNVAAVSLWNLYMQGSPLKEKAGECLNYALLCCQSEDFNIRNYSIRFLGACIGTGSFGPDCFSGCFQTFQQYCASIMSKERTPDSHSHIAYALSAILVGQCPDPSFSGLLFKLFPLAIVADSDKAFVLKAIEHQISCGNQLFLDSGSKSAIKQQISAWKSARRLSKELRDSMSSVFALIDG